VFLVKKTLILKCYLYDQTKDFRICYAMFFQKCLNIHHALKMKHEYKDQNLIDRIKQFLESLKENLNFKKKSKK